MHLASLTRLNIIFLVGGTLSFLFAFADEEKPKVNFVKIEVASSAHPSIQQNLDKLSASIPIQLNVRPSAELANTRTDSDILIAATLRDRAAIKQHYDVAAEKDLPLNRFVIISSNKMSNANLLGKARSIYANRQYAEVAQLYVEHAQKNQMKLHLIQAENSLSTFHKALSQPDGTSVVFATLSDWDQHRNTFTNWHITPLHAENFGGNKNISYGIFLTKKGAAKPHARNVYNQLA